MKRKYEYELLRFKYNDGGRAAAGFKGKTGDCTCRAIAILLGLPYKRVYYRLYELAGQTPRTGIPLNKLDRILPEEYGLRQVKLKKHISVYRAGHTFGDCLAFSKKHAYVVRDYFIQDIQDGVCSTAEDIFEAWLPPWEKATAEDVWY